MCYHFMCAWDGLYEQVGIYWGAYTTGEEDERTWVDVDSYLKLIREMCRMKRSTGEN